MSELATFLVEDSPTIRENLIAALEELTPVKMCGYAAGEEEAKDWLKRAHEDQNSQEPWRLAIVDLFLAQGSGLGVIAACRQRQPGQKVVVLSNYIHPEMREHCLSLGADEVFDKSRDIDALIGYCQALSDEANVP